MYQQWEVSNICNRRLQPCAAAREMVMSFAFYVFTSRVTTRGTRTECHVHNAPQLSSSSLLLASLHPPLLLSQKERRAERENTHTHRICYFSFVRTAEVNQSRRSWPICFVAGRTQKGDVNGHFPLSLTCYFRQADLLPSFLMDVLASPFLGVTPAVCFLRFPVRRLSAFLQEHYYLHCPIISPTRPKITPRTT